MSLPNMPAIFTKVSRGLYLYDFAIVRTYRSIDDVFDCVHRNLLATGKDFYRYIRENISSSGSYCR